MSHLFTMNTDGNVSDASGKVVASLGDQSHILDFMSGVAAGVHAVGREIVGEIIREGDYQAWEAAAVARERSKNGPQRTEANGLCYVVNCPGCDKLHTDV